MDHCGSPPLYLRPLGRRLGHASSLSTQRSLGVSHICSSISISAHYYVLMIQGLECQMIFLHVHGADCIYTISQKSQFCWWNANVVVTGETWMHSSKKGKYRTEQYQTYLKWKKSFKMKFFWCFQASLLDGTHVDLTVQVGATHTSPVSPLQTASGGNQVKLDNHTRVTELQCLYSSLTDSTPSMATPYTSTLLTNGLPTTKFNPPG